MENPIVEVALPENSTGPAPADWLVALEAGKVLYFPHLPFTLTTHEQGLLRPELRQPKSRNISLGPDDKLKGAAAEEAALTAMLLRFRAQALDLVHRLAPQYEAVLRLGNTSFRPAEVESRQQSLRANDRLLHVDAFPSRPNRGERILRVFSNINPAGRPRVWHLGEPFEVLARRFLPLATPYSPWQARLMHKLSITKSLRSEYDHLMLQLHDAMKSDVSYQQSGEQISMDFAPGSTWVCFSDQTAHAVVSGQYMVELTLHLAAEKQLDPAASPLAILTRLQGHALV